MSQPDIGIDLGEGESKCHVYVYVRDPHSNTNIFLGTTTRPPTITFTPDKPIDVDKPAKALTDMGADIVSCKVGPPSPFDEHDAERLKTRAISVGNE